MVESVLIIRPSCREWRSLSDRHLARHQASSAQAVQAVNMTHRHVCAGYFFLACFLQFSILNSVEGMTKKLNHFSSELTRVIRDVGIEGRLGGQVTFLSRSSPN